MTEAAAQQEPSIEEILASIRRIISEDGEPEEAAAAEPDDAPAAEAEAEDDVLDLTDRVDQPAADDSPTKDTSPPFEAEDTMPDLKNDLADPDALVSEPVAQRTTDVLARLAPREVDRTDDPLPIADRTLEQVVRQLMRPMLREWLDTNLPAIVERAVERELRRIGRRAEDLH